MMIGPISEQTPVPSGSAHVHTPWARWSVRLAEAAAVLVALAFALFGVAYVVGGSEATEDNWVGWVTVATFFGGFLTSVMAFVLAATATVKHERWTLLWLPLTVCPALLAFLVLGEAFWWE